MLTRTKERHRPVYCCSKEGQNDQERYQDRPSTAGITKEPSDATPNNQLHFVLCTCENVLTITVFVYVIICCKIHFVFFILVVHTNHENIFTTKISKSTAYVWYVNSLLKKS